MSEYPSGPPTGDHVFGDDPPNPHTKNFSLNHFALRIKEPERSLKFYKDILGMRELFHVNADSFSIYYLGCGDEEPTSVAMANMMDRRGMIELLHLHGTEKDSNFSYNTSQSPVGFGHLGFCVPDIESVGKRLKEKGVEISKPQGIASAETIGFPAGTAKPHDQWIKLFKHMICIKDRERLLTDIKSRA